MSDDHPWRWGVHRILGLMYGPLPVGWLVAAVGIGIYLLVRSC